MPMPLLTRLPALPTPPLPVLKLVPKLLLKALKLLPMPPLPVLKLLLKPSKLLLNKSRDLSQQRLGRGQQWPRPFLTRGAGANLPRRSP
jgi:hypothetical protein